MSNETTENIKIELPPKPAGLRVTRETHCIAFKRVISACGEIFRAIGVVNGSEFRFEMALDKKWLNIIDHGSACETWKDEGDGLTFAGGEHITFDWLAEDIARVDAAASQA